MGRVCKTLEIVLPGIGDLRGCDNEGVDVEDKVTDR